MNCSTGNIQSSKCCLLHCTGFALLWAALSTWVGWYAVGTGFPDGFQSVGATFGDKPGHLFWPMMGGFEGFDHAWGYHWFGWPLLRSLLSVLVPWSALGDGIALHLLRVFVAVWVGVRLLMHVGSVPAAWVGMLTVLLNRGWFCSMAFLYRPETIVAILLWLASLPLINGEGRRSSINNGLSVLSLALLPLMHPLAWPAAILLAIMGSLTIRRSVGSTHWVRKSCLRWWLPLVLGFGLFAAYYLADPLRLGQLKDTLQTTALIRSGVVATAERLLMEPKNVFFSAPVLAVLGFSVLAVRFGSSPWKAWVWDGLGLSIAMVLLSLVYLFVAGHPNTGHATVMAPFLGYSAGRLFDLEWKSTAVRRFAHLTLIGQAAVCAVPLFLTVGSFLLHPPESPRARAVAVLDRALRSTSGRVLIPLSLWEASGEVSEEDRRRIRFTTFPNWVSLKRRMAYEEYVLGSLNIGDILIQDETPPELGDPADLLPWPRSLELRGRGVWLTLMDFEPVVNTTLVVGRYRRDEMLLGPMRVLRYQSTN